MEPSHEKNSGTFTIVDRNETEAPIADALFRKFPVLKDNPRLVITYFPNVYVRGGQLPPALVIHEATHIEQQSHSGPELWWEQYLNDPEFRLSQEMEAYAQQLCFYDQFPNTLRKRAKFLIASDLSSEFYGNIISHLDAETRVSRYAKTIREAKQRTEKKTPPAGTFFTGG
jgi:hypothetical protein